MKRKFIKNGSDNLNENNDIDIELCFDEERYMYNIKGKVVDKLTGSALSNVFIKILDENNEEIVHELTDRNGIFNIRCYLPRSIYISAYKKGFIQYKSELLMLDEYIRRVLRIRLEKEEVEEKLNSIYGTVIAWNERKANNINVYLKDERTGKVHFTTTNSEGEYIFSNLKPGRYTLIYKSNFYQEQMLKISLKEHNDIVTLPTVTLKPRVIKGFVSGIIRDEEGSIQEDAIVYLMNAKTDEVVKSVRTDEEGRYIFSSLSRGIYYIIVK